MTIGATLGVPYIILMLAMMGFAMWKRDWIRVILSICIITWGVFVAPYNIRIGGTLVAIGTLLFIMGIVNLIGRHREEKEST